MKVFISWSGEKSKRIAAEIHKWLPSVIQAIKPYFSPDDIAKGTRWATEIAVELESSKIGLLIVAGNNAEAPWLVFEAGALSKSLGRSRVCPILFDVEPTDVSGPIVQFQGAKFDQAEMRRVVKMMNSELGEAALTSDVLEGVFAMWWPQLEKKIVSILEQPGEAGDTRSDRDMLEEILSLTRSANRDVRLNSSFPHPAALEDLLENYAAISMLADKAADKELAAAIARMRGVIHYFDTEGRRRRRRTPPPAPPVPPPAPKSEEDDEIPF